MTNSDAVPAQVATWADDSWDTLARQCILAAKQGGHIPDDLYDRALAAHKREARPVEPQAGAQVPSQESTPLEGVQIISRVTQMPVEMIQIVLEDGSCNSGMDVERYAHAAYHFAAEYVTTEAALTQARTALQRIRSYVKEAAKTPITREDMHDHLKAQTFYDEAQGLYRLVLSEADPKEKA